MNEDKAKRILEEYNPKHPTTGKMKQLRTFMTLCLVAMTLGVAITSCEKEELNGGSTDTPLPGSITVKMRNEDNGCTKIVFGISNVFINEANNFEVASVRGFDNNDQEYREEIEIASVGKVNGLGGITTIPESGWIDEASVFVGHGYVVRWQRNDWGSDTDSNKSDYSYGRIFVHDEIVSTGGGIIGYTVSYIEGM